MCLPAPWSTRERQQKVYSNCARLCPSVQRSRVASAGWSAGFQEFEYAAFQLFEVFEVFELAEGLRVSELAGEAEDTLPSPLPSPLP